MKDLISLDKKNYLPVFNRYPIVFERGEGVFLYDNADKKYIDMLAGIAVNSLGYAHPAVLQTLSLQASRLMHVSNFFLTRPQVELADKLISLSGLGKVFFANSGTESVEGAIKIARKYAHSIGKGGNVISFDGCFHGRTIASMALGSEKLHQGFEPIPLGFQKARYNDIDSVISLVNTDTAAIIIELIQGEGGVHLANESFVRELRVLCDRENIVLIFDEIQCGSGRSGKMFSYQHYDVTPDIATMAKGLGAGFPIGAILCSSQIASALQYGDHGSTFGGNPLACAVALTCVGEIEKLLDQITSTGMWFKDELCQLQTDLPEIIAEVRGCGLMIGVQLSVDGKHVVEKLLDSGVVANVTSSNVIRFVPPLIISKEELFMVLTIFRSVLIESV